MRFRLLVLELRDKLPQSAPTAMTVAPPASAVKHTPGPWKVVRDSKSVLLEVRGDNMTRVAEVWTDTEGGQERRVANADLVAAAPDLLAACERALSSGAIKFADNALDLGIREALTAAIAKARGGA